MVIISEATVRDRIVSRLKDLGLSTHEALAYTTLLMHPNITASTLCKEISIPDSKIYYALDGLSKKGMLTVQQGNPNIYRPIPPREAVANLKQQLTEQLNEKIKEANVLIDLLTPIYDSAEKPEELELAYIIRGRRNILNRMKALIKEARKEITVFVSHPPILKELEALLIEAMERHIKVNIGMTKQLLKNCDLSGLGDVKLLLCPCSLLISDMRMLLTVSDWTDEIAMLTQDQNLMRISRDYYDNPSCCASITEKLASH